MKEHIYFNAFNQINQVGSVRFRRLLNFFPDLETAWRAPIQQLQQAGLEESIVQKIIEARTQVDPETEFAKLQKQNIRLITYQDENFPKLLKEIPNPPIVLYALGNFAPQDGLAVAVVGSRKFTPYGQRVVADLVRDLVRANITIVSGLALGIDALAHRTALEYNGRTVAVLACGLDSIYPASNRTIAQKIRGTGGVIISEHPLGTPPLKHHFPHRNRIISGLSLGTVIIEADTDSGALITAQHTLEQNRQVFAVPGSIYSPTSAGPHNLLKMGAKPVTNVNDILEDLNLGHLQQQILTADAIGDNAEEQKILDFLNQNPLHFDQIVKLANLAAATLAATLTILEMKGKIKNLGGNQYVKAR